MTQYLWIRHKVRDFDQWKSAFEAHRPERLEAGLTDMKLLRSAGDPNEIVLLFEAKDLPRAQAFTASPNLREVMQAAGVIDKPDIYFLTE